MSLNTTHREFDELLVRYGFTQMDRSNPQDEVNASKKTKPSRWAMVAERMRNNPTLKKPEFQKAWRKMRADMQECREGFDFYGVQHKKVKCCW